MPRDVCREEVVVAADSDAVFAVVLIVLGGKQTLGLPGRNVNRKPALVLVGHDAAGVDAGEDQSVLHCTDGLLCRCEELVDFGC